MKNKEIRKELLRIAEKEVFLQTSKQRMIFAAGHTGQEVCEAFSAEAQGFSEEKANTMREQYGANVLPSAKSAVFSAALRPRLSIRSP